MKISLNLAIAPSRRERYALTWAIPTCVLGAAGLVLLSILALRNYREYRAAREALLGVHQVEAKLQEHEAALKRDLERPQLREMYRQTQFVNTLIHKKQFSVTDLIVKVAELLPGQVRLDALGVAHPENDSVVRIAVAGNSDKDIEEFLRNLEDSPDFAEVTIVNQGVAHATPEGGGTEPQSFVCTARYVGGQAH